MYCKGDDFMIKIESVYPSNKKYYYQRKQPRQQQKNQSSYQLFRNVLKNEGKKKQINENTLEV